MKNKDSILNGLIIYNSKYGATRQYAEWLAQALKIPLIRSGETTAAQVTNADFLLIGTPVYMGKFRMLKWIRKNMKNIRNKKLFFFIVNATAPGELAKRDKFVLDNLPGEIRAKSSIYFLPGRLIHKKLTLFDRLMVAIGVRIEKNPEKRKAMRSDLDAVKKDNLTPLINSVNDFYYRGQLLSSTSVATHG
ncbi:hypothetical protein FW778_20750 [Ginsengibacter hankyongi]|uniref:Flavodoxin domain-containing protein n=1 Tax=Ginsengibacter hankyongi TaxID=2607284 RepID=A0A5J5IAP2_9BACT|nr:flavodoxin domain-containing protein [Ginsengibacter hankyongi]KAA9035656.1 hypothetical protein FW778_20750 [Ginsengibacter hankyongi]